MPLARFKGWPIGLATCIGIGIAACASPPQPQTPQPAAGSKPCASKKPPYPAEALLSGHQGVVRVAALIAADGSFLKGEVRKSSGSAILDRATVAAASGWCWKPSVENGAPVQAWQEFDYTWTLD